MLKLLTTLCLVVMPVGHAFAQQLLPADVAAIERAALEYTSGTLPKGDIGLDPDVAHGRPGMKRDSARLQGLTRALGARVVHADSVLACGKDPSTCKLGVDALVRVGEPVATLDGAVIVIEVLRRSGFANQPVSKGSKELVLAKKDGVWGVVRVAGRSTS